MVSILVQHKESNYASTNEHPSKHGSGHHASRGEVRETDWLLAGHRIPLVQRSGGCDSRTRTAKRQRRGYAIPWLPAVLHDDPGGMEGAWHDCFAGAGTSAAQRMGVRG